MLHFNETTMNNPIMSNHADRKKDKKDEDIPVKIAKSEQLLRERIAKRTSSYEVIGWGTFEEYVGYGQNLKSLKLCLVQIAYRGIVAFALIPEDQLKTHFENHTRNPKNVFEQQDNRYSKARGTGESFRLLTAVGYTNYTGLCSPPYTWHNFENGGAIGSHFETASNLCCAVILVQYNDGERHWIKQSDFWDTLGDGQLLENLARIGLLNEHAFKAIKTRLHMDRQGNYGIHFSAPKLAKDCSNAGNWWKTKNFNGNWRHNPKAHGYLTYDFKMIKEKYSTIESVLSSMFPGSRH